MRNTFESILKSIREYWVKLKRGERIRLIILAVLVISLGIVVATILSRTTYATLYSGLTEDAAGEIFNTLLEMGEDVHMQGTSTILVPEGRVSELRVTLASQGYQNTGYSYDLLDRATGFGVTDLEKQTLLQYQLEDHITTMLKQITKISDCWVKLSLPKESLFALSNADNKASATVMLVVSDGSKLSQSEINSIADMVVTAVPGLEPENLTISDSNMNSYKVGDDSGITGDVDSQLAFKQNFQAMLEEQALNVITPIFGADAARVTVNAVLSFDDKVSESVEFAPPVEGETEGLVISAYSLWEASRNDGEAIGAPGTDENGMGTPEYPYGELDDGETYEQRILETNYELNRTTTQIKENGYKVSDLSVAIVVDSAAVAEDYTRAVTNLVAMAIGVDADYISVERLPFNDVDQSISDAMEEREAFMREMQLREYIEKAVTWALIIILAVVFLLLVRSIVKSARRPLEPEEGDEALREGVDYLAAEEILQEAGLDLDIDLNAKPEAVMSLEKLIDRDAGAVAALLRNWITDD